MKHKFTVFALLLVLILFSCPALALADQKLYKLNQQTWEYYLGDSPEQNNWQTLSTPEHIPNTENYKYIWLRTKLPKIKVDNPVIYTNRSPQILMPYEFYINGQRFFQNGQLQGNSQLADHLYSLVLLPENWQGKYLYIRIYNNHYYPAQDINLIKFIGPYKKTVQHIFNKNLLPFLLSLTYLIISYLIFYLFFFHYKHILLLSIGGMVLSAFIYTITHNPITSFLFSQIITPLDTLYYFNVFILGSLITFYLSQILTYHQQLLVKISIGYLITGIIAFSAYLTNPYTKIMGAKIYNLTLIGVIAIVTYALIKTYLAAKTEEKEKLKILSLGFLTAIVGGLLAVFRAMAHQFEPLSPLKTIFNQLPFRIEDYTSIGLFFFILTLIHVTGKHFVQISQLASRDGLTELYNHNYFKQKLMHRIKQTKNQKLKLSLLMIDIDNFKQLNDTYGHPAGDIVLQKLAQLLKKHCRDKDTVARYGGEEFTIILPGVDKEKGIKIAHRLIKVIRQLTVNYEENQLQITVSIGLASYNHNQSRQDLVAQADQALYQAKRNGKNQIHAR